MKALPPGWTEASLGDVASWSSGGTPKATTPDYYGGGIPWAVIGDLNDAVVVETATSITEKGLAESRAKLVEPGTILVAMYGSIGKLGIAGTRMATNQAIACAVPHEVVDRMYLYWYLRTIRRELQHSGKGATQKNIGQGILKAWQIPLPPLPEQQRIVEAIEEQVSRLDAAERAVARCRRHLRQLRRRSISQLLERVEPDQALGDVAEVASGATPKGLKPAPGGSIPFFKVGDMNTSEGRHMRAARLHLDDAAIAVHRLKMWPPGTVVFPKQGGAIATNKKRLLAVSGACDLNTMGVIPSSQLLSDYLWLVLQTVDLTTLSDGSVVPQIRPGRIAALRIPVPSREQQHAVVAEAERQLSIIDSLETALSEGAVRSSALRQSLLREAFEGRLAPQDPQVEPMSSGLRASGQRVGNHE